METRKGTLLAAVLVLTFISIRPPAAAADKAQWQSGRLLAADISGHGPNAGIKNVPSGKRSDIWWDYCLFSGGKTYSAVSRESPARTGLAVNGLVKCSIARDRIQVLTPKRGPVTMKIVRQGNENICRQ